MLCAGGDVAHSRGSGTPVYRNALTAFLHREGWCAPVYGQLVPTSTIRLSTDAGAPLTLVTWIGSGRTFHAPQIRCADALGDGAVIVEVVDGPRTMVFMVQPADSSRPRHLGRPVEIETDAAMLHYSTESGHLQRLVAQGTGGCPLLRINGLDLPLVPSRRPTPCSSMDPTGCRFQPESPFLPRCEMRCSFCSPVSARKNVEFCR